MKYIREMVIAVLVIGFIYLLYKDYTTPYEDPNHKQIIDSLTRNSNDLTKKLNIALDSARHYEIMSDTWYNEAMKTRAMKTQVKIKYVQDTSYYRNLPVGKRDSIIRAIFYKN